MGLWCLGGVEWVDDDGSFEGWRWLEELNWEVFLSLEGYVNISRVVVCCYEEVY